MRLDLLLAASTLCGLSTAQNFSIPTIPKAVFPPPQETSVDVNVQNEFDLSIQTPDLQNMKTSKLILANGLKAYIISDPGIVKAGVALSVETGNWRDPPGVSGLAHFTEHMLFMGSEEFPAESEYNRYIEDHGGYANAYTTTDHTVFYFTIQPHGLLGGLDRISQFFIAPLLAPSALERERNAVNSEYRMAERSDSRRLWYVIQDIMRATNHPFSHWGCGSLITLSSLDQTNITAWFKAEYDPRGMHLIVNSHEPVQVLERRVKAKFGNIPYSPEWKGPVRSASSGEIIPPGVLRSWVFVEPIKNFRQLTMMWQIPDKFGEVRNRVAEVVATVLGSLGDGTLLSKLKSAALARSIYTSVENEAADAAFFYIKVDLTEQGLTNYRRVVEIVFQALGTLGRLNSPAYIVEQHNALSTLNYKWQERTTGDRVYADAVRELRAQDFASYPKKSLLWEHSPYDVAEIFLDHLSPNNCIIFIQAKSTDCFNVAFEKSEPIAAAKYTITNLTGDDLALFNTAHGSVQQDIQYPPQSLYIPEQNLRVLRYLDPLQVNRSRWEPLPMAVKALDPSSESFLSTFIAGGDTEFGIPKISFRNSFFSPALNTGANPRKEVVVYLWIKSVYETTEVMRAAAALGGYSFSISTDNTPSPRLSITVSGFSSRDAVSKLMQGIYDAIRFPQLTTSCLRSAIDNLRLTYQNYDHDQRYVQAKHVFARWSSNPSLFNTPQSIVAEIDKILAVDSWEASIEDEIRDVIHRVFLDGGKGFHEFSLYGGNMEEQDVRSIQTVRKGASLVPSLPVIPPLSMEEAFRASFINKTSQPVLLHKYLASVPYGQSVARLEVPTGTISDPTAVAFTHVIANLCSGPFFASLRSRDQLGYAVGSNKRYVRTQGYIFFVVQTEKLNGTDTLKRIDNWIQNWIVTGLSEKDEYVEIDGEKNTTVSLAEHFNKTKAAVIKELESKHPSMEAKTEEQENLLFWHRENLAIQELTLAALRNMTREGFRAAIKTYFGNKADWRAVVLDASEGADAVTDISLDGWSVTTEDSLDAEVVEV